MLRRPGGPGVRRPASLDWWGNLTFAGGMVVAALSFVLLELLPVDFAYWQFALILLLNGIGMGAVRLRP